MSRQQFREIDLSKWRQVGEGGNGKTYICPDDPDVLLKVNNARLSTLEAVTKEYNVSRKVQETGLSVPRMKEIVRVSGVYGTITERIAGKKSLSKICHDSPEKTEEMAEFLCERAKELFSKECDTEFFPDRKKQLLSALEKATFLGKETLGIISAFARNIPDCTTCVHGDLQMGNLIVSEGKYYWIDLDRFGYGDPMFDIGHLYLLCKVYSSMKRVQELFHISKEQFDRFWDAFARAYTGKDNHEEFDLQAKRFACIDIILRTHFMKPTFLEKMFFKMHVRKLIGAFK